MPHSHHSHSGQFCGHAKDTLEQVIQSAISRGFHTFALTEHIPRPLEDFYPEEQDSHTEATLAALFSAYLTEATRLRTLYASQINLLIGFESEWIRPSTLTTIQSILSSPPSSSTPKFDLLIGSVHHVHTIPIDFDRATYDRACDAAGGTDERLFEDYFDAQLEMLQALKPPLVGHFDLIRLLSDRRDAPLTELPGVWERAVRNLEFIASYGGVLELNSAGLRKGLAEPYPGDEVCRRFLEIGGRFALSDDSHGREQLATNYGGLMAYVKKVGITTLWHLSDEVKPEDERFAAGWKSIEVEEVLAMAGWGIEE